VDIYRDQSRTYFGIGRQLERRHRQVGRGLRRAPFGRYTAPAWNAPRHINRLWNR
jgi:hypothetical protein